MSFEVKDSGARQEYASGMKRDTTEGKPDYTLIPREFLTRWAWHMTRGAAKYGRANWRKANSAEELERFQSSALRHMVQWLDGDRDEDHASAVAFNVAAAEYVRAELDAAEAAETPEPERPVIFNFTEPMTPESAREWSRRFARELRTRGVRGHW